MQFELSETQKLLQKAAREFLQAECPMSEVRRIMQTPDAHDRTLWRKMADQGWLGLLVPEEYGGMGLGMVELAVLFEQTGRALLPGPFHSTVAYAAPILMAGSEEQKRRYLPALCNGSATYAVASMHYGHAMFVADAGAADFLILANRLVPRDAVTVDPLKAYDLTRKLSEVSVDAGTGELIARGNAELVATLALAAEMTGGMQRVLELTVAYAKVRKQFDQPIGKFQTVQHMCADMFLWVESSRSAVYYAAYALDKNLPDAAPAVSVAKVYASDMYRECCNRGIQVHGGMGFTWENEMHLYFRRAKACENALGSAREHRERIAQAVVEPL